MNAVTLTAPTTVPEDVVTLVANAVQLAEATEISCPVTAEIAGEDLRTLAGMKKKLENARFEITRPLDAAKAAVMSLFKPQAEKIDQADRILRGKLNTYLEEQRRIAAKAAAEAAAKVAAEQRILDEQRRKAEDEARAAAEKGDAEAAAIAREKAEAIEEERQLAELSQPAAVAAPKMAGISTAKTWAVKQIDLLELAKAAVENPDLLDYLLPNSVEINKVVKALGARHRIPGVTAIQQESLRVRS